MTAPELREFELLPQLIPQLKTVSERYNVSYEKLVNEVKERCTDPMIINDALLMSEEDRQDFVVAQIKVNYARYANTLDAVTIPIGYYPKIIPKSGKVQRNLVAIVQTENMASPRLSRIVLQGERPVASVSSLSLFSRYNTQIKQFSSGDFFIDMPDISFENPQYAGEPSKILTALPEIIKITTGNAASHLSVKDVNGKYTVVTDLRLLNAMVTSKQSGARKDGSPWYKYVVMDAFTNLASADLSAPQPQPGLTVWLDENFFQFNEQDYLTFLGAVELRQSAPVPGEPARLPSLSMNACTVIQAHTVPEVSRN